MARAKRTERAEARRRYRATMAADDDAETIGDDVASAETGATGNRRRTSTTKPSNSGTAGPTGRVGFAQAFRLSFRPMNVREDLASVPWIAIHTKALWVPLAITVAATVYIIVAKGQDVISQFAFTYFIQTPAIGGVFIAGFLAPRASWLMGVIVGLFSAVCYSLLVVSFSSILPFATAAPTDSEIGGVVVTALVLSSIIGAFFAAAAGWYRRFLAYSSPNRSRQSQTAKPRAGDGRTRTSGSQKAPAKR